MKRIVLLACIFASGYVLWYASAEANPIQDVIVYQPLGSGDLADCAGRVDDDFTDFADVTESDGMRWQYVVEPQAGEISAELRIDFVCKANSNPFQLGVLAISEVKWACVPIAAGVNVAADVIQFEGTGGAWCQGATVQRAVQDTLGHLSVDLPAKIEVTHLFASTMVASNYDKGDCSLEQVLFNNEDIRYALPVDAQGVTRILFENRPGSSQTFSDLSSPVTLTSQSDIISLVDGAFGARTFVHMANGQVLTTSPIDNKWLFEMSLDVDNFMLGVGSDGFFCGDVSRLVVDPYAGIGSD